MKLAFLGSGNMAVGLGRQLANGGHELTFAFGRDMERLNAQAKLASDKAAVRSPSEAAEWADVVILTVPFNAAAAALQSAGDLAGKIVWSIVNPLKSDFSGLEVGTTTSGAEELAKLVPDARFVAALPPFAEVLHLPEPLPLKPSVFVCGQDNEAKAIVHGLLSEIGADPVEGGELFAARFFEPALMGLVYLAYGRGLGGAIGLHFIR